MNEVETLTLGQAADLLGISMVKLRKLIADGELATEVNPLDRRERLVSRQAVDDLLLRGKGAGRTRGRTPAERPGRRLLALRSPLWADAEDLVAWASRTDASLNLPRLIRRLILEAGDVLDPPRLRAGEGILLSGWDGVSVFAGKHAYVPKGVGLWELGRDKAIKAKADRDYAKRTNDPLGFEPGQSTFVFVTPRRWPEKLDWQGARRRERKWRDVRVYDADDLEAWLDLAPVTRAWLSRLFRKTLEGVIALEDWWSDWCQSTSPNLSVDIVLAGEERANAAQAIQTRLTGDPSAFAIQADSAEEAVAVLASSISTLPEEQAGTISASAILVENAASWEHLVGEGSRLFLVPGFPDCEPSTAVRAGHTVIVPLGREDVGMDAVEVPRLRREPAEAALISAGVQRDLASDWATLARRSLLALRRRLSTAPLLRRPAWCTFEAARTLVPIMLAGFWNGDLESDQAVLAELVGLPYEQLEADLVRLAHVSDPPLRQVGGCWLICDKFDAWQLTNQYITRSDLDRFRGALEGILASRSQFEREASLLGPGRPMVVQRPSLGLRQGLVDSLALMASDGISVGQIDGQDFANAVVSAVLERLPHDGSRLWPELSDVLPLLAEAAPEVFLDALEERTSEQDPLPGEVRVNGPADTARRIHAGLLWALETLAWSPDCLYRATLLLARLSRLTYVNPRIANNPDASLRSIFLAWLPGTAAGPDDRFDIIDTVWRTEPEGMWRLLRALLPRAHDIGHPTAKPRWRPWVPDREPGVIDEACQQCYEWALGRLLVLAKGHAERWLELLEDFNYLPTQFKEAIILGLETDSLVADLSGRARLWDRLRVLVSEHEYFSDAFWRMTDGQLQAMERLADRYQPASVVERTEWAFSSRRHRSLARDGSEDHFEALQEVQDQAAHEIFLVGGLDLLFDAARQFEEPFELGAAAGRSVQLPEDVEARLLAQLASSEVPTRHLARGYVAGAFAHGGWRWVDRIAARLKGRLGSSQWGDLLSVIPPASEVVDYAETMGPEVVAEYWRQFPVWPALAANDLERACQGLLSAGRVADAVRLLGLNIEGKTVRSELVVGVLEAVPADGPDLRADTMDTHFLTRLLDYLTADPAVDRSRIARLEWIYSSLLRFQRPPSLLHQRLQADPSFFVDVVAAVYRGEHESESPPTAEAAARATMAYDVLESWQLVPGRSADDAINEQTLQEWVDEAREFLARGDRLKVGDHQIGKLLGKTGLGVRDGVPSAAVCAVIERVASPELERGILIGVLNARGVTMRSLTTGGEQERRLATTYRTYAEAVRNRWPRTANLLRRIGAIYEGDARREDREAELTEDLWR